MAAPDTPTPAHDVLVARIAREQTLRDAENAVASQAAHYPERGGDLFTFIACAQAAIHSLQDVAPTPNTPPPDMPAVFDDERSIYRQQLVEQRLRDLLRRQGAELHSVTPSRDTRGLAWEVSLTHRGVLSSTRIRVPERQSATQTLGLLYHGVLAHLAEREG